jgi:hypothetical protein
LPQPAATMAKPGDRSPLGHVQITQIMDHERTQLFKLMKT